MFINQATSLLKDKWKFIMQHLNDQVLLDSLHSIVPFPTMLGFNTLVDAIQEIAANHYRKMGVPVETILGCDTIVDAVNVLFHNNEVFMDIFVNHVWVFFHTDLKVANQMVRMTENLSNLPPEMVRTYAKIVARTAVTFTENPSPVAQALVLESQPSDTLPDDEPVSIVRVLPDPPPRNDATDLILADVKENLESCVANAITKAAESFDAGNRSTVIAIVGAPLDAQVLATEVTGDANGQAMEALADAFAALEVVEAVKAAADAGESVQPDTSFSEFEPGDSEAASLFLEIASESDNQFHTNGVGGPLSVISERTKDGADQSGDSSPHSSDGGRRAPSTTSAQFLLQGVEDGASGAQPPFSSVDLSRSVDAPKSPLSNLSSGPSGTSLTHELSMLLAASMPSSSQSSFTHDAVTSADGSTPAQSSGKPLAPAPPPPLKTNVIRQKMNGGGAHLSGIPIGNPPGNAQSIVGGSGNPPANLPSFPLEGDVGGHPVQVLARSVDPSSDSGGADHLETPSIWSSCIPGGKTSSASQPGNSSISWRNIFFRRIKLNRVNPNPGQTNDTCSQVTHSSGKILSGSATTTTTSLPSSISPLGGNIGGNPEAQIQADRLVNVPSPAPSLSPELGSAAATALSLPCCPSGHDIGGIERTWVRSEIDYLVLTMKYASAPWTNNPPLLSTHPCLLRVPNLARLARVA